MKKLCILLTIALLTIFCSSCASDGTEAFETAEFASEAPENKLDLPYRVEPTVGEVVSNVQNVKPWEEWGITGVDGENALKRREYEEGKPVTVPAGTGSEPALNIGDISWEGYSATFDFFMGKSGMITFALYAESGITPIEGGYPTNEQRFWFALHPNGGISFETTFIDSHFLVNDDGSEVRIENFDPSVWNTMTLKNTDNKLVIILNGVESAEIYEFDGSEYGRLALGGGAGSMFKNICIE